MLQSDLAVLIAGQIRTFEEFNVRLALRHTFGLDQVPRNKALVAFFFHVSSEHTYAKWHSRWHSLNNISQTIRLHELRRQIELELHPRYLNIASDDTTRRSRMWSGTLIGDSEGQSLLMFRWLLLREANFVLRIA